MSLKKILPLFLIFIAIILAIYFYPLSPATMVTHWGFYGEPNGYSGKFFALFFMPILSIFLYLLFRFLPQTDPYHSNFKEFEKYFDTFINIFFIFLFYLYILTLFWNLISPFNLTQFLTPAFALLFYYIGVLLTVAKKNWFVGIRNPWTMSSDSIWQKTHRLGGQLFKFVALLSLVGIIFPSLAIYLVFVPIILISLFLYLYSYLLSRS